MIESKIYKTTKIPTSLLQNNSYFAPSTSLLTEKELIRFLRIPYMLFLTTFCNHRYQLSGKPFAK